jgi:hypothetical protein
MAAFCISFELVPPLNYDWDVSVMLSKRNETVS